MKTLIITLSFISSVALAGQKNVSTSGGRFQLIQLSDMRRDQYLLDTQTGKMWTASCEIPGEGPGDCSFMVWVPELIIDINTTYERVKKLKESTK